MSDPLSPKIAATSGVTKADALVQDLRRLEKVSRSAAPTKRPITDGQGYRRYKVSVSGQLTLPATARQRWGLRNGGRVAVADLGYAILIVPDGGWREASDAWLSKDRLRAVLAERLNRED